jgi:hypothetical protein
MADTERLRALMREHMATPFPSSVEKGEDYGLVDAVLVGADLYGWCDTIATGSRLSDGDTLQLRRLRDELRESIGAFPDDARPYYEHLVQMASVALDERA